MTHMKTPSAIDSEPMLIMAIVIRGMRKILRRPTLLDTSDIGMAPKVLTPAKAARPSMYHMYLDSMCLFNIHNPYQCIE